MVVRRLAANAFRNLRIPQAELVRGINILYGDNAQGKTNFLEAFYFCALGRPLRAEHCRELIPIGAQEAHVQAFFESDIHQFTVDGYIRTQNGKCVKAISIDRVPVRNTRELFGRVPVVSFSPEDMRLVKAGPAERRRFMDIEICQLSPVYYQELHAYFRVLKQRNHLLKTIQKGKNKSDELTMWDEQLIKHGNRIMKSRRKFVAQLLTLAQEIHHEITQGREALHMEYKPNIPDPDGYAAILERHQPRDIVLGTTSAGIHRDDIVFSIKGISARSFGSQGQQRTAALAVKLAEIELMRERTGVAPILLLDDVFSELDKNRQHYLLQRIGHTQTILTCTGIEDALHNGLGGYHLIHIENGCIKEL